MPKSAKKSSKKAAKKSSDSLPRGGKIAARPIMLYPKSEDDRQVITDAADRANRKVSDYCMVTLLAASQPSPA